MRDNDHQENEGPRSYPVSVSASQIQESKDTIRNRPCIPATKDKDHILMPKCENEPESKNSKQNPIKLERLRERGENVTHRVYDQRNMRYYEMTETTVSRKEKGGRLQNQGAICKIQQIESNRVAKIVPIGFMTKRKSSIQTSKRVNPLACDLYAVGKLIQGLPSFGEIDEYLKEMMQSLLSHDPSKILDALNRIRQAETIELMITVAERERLIAKRIVSGENFEALAKNYARVVGSDVMQRILHQLDRSLLNESHLYQLEKLLAGIHIRHRSFQDARKSIERAKNQIFILGKKKKVAFQIREEAALDVLEEKLTKG